MTETDHQTFAMRGEIDLVASDRIEPHLLAYAAETGSDEVLIDCSAMTFIDSSGLGMLVEVGNRSGKRLVLEHVSDVCRRAFEVTGLDTVFHVK